MITLEIGWENDDYANNKTTFLIRGDGLFFKDKAEVNRPRKDRIQLIGSKLIDSKVRSLKRFQRDYAKAVILNTK